MSATLPERRSNPRTPQHLGTFAHRLTGAESSVVRLEITDLAATGVGVCSMIPLRIGETMALGITHDATREIALCQVQHTGKSASGQFRAGALIVERVAGDLNQTRLPASWKKA